MMEWEGGYLDTEELEGPYPPSKWPGWLHPYDMAYALYRHKGSNGAVIRCQVCDYALTLPVFPWPEHKAKARKWLAGHWLEHAIVGEGLILEVMDDAERDLG